jgi:hydrogenase maturation protease
MSLVVGLGSPQGDDQLGWVAIDWLRPRLPEGIVAEKVRDGVELLLRLEGHDTAVVIDAAIPAGQPGLVRSFVWPAPELVQCAPWSTHGLGLVAALRLAEALGCLPRHVSIYTIEAHDVSAIGDLSDDVAQPLDSVVEAVIRDVTGRGVLSERSFP